MSRLLISDAVADKPGLKASQTGDRPCRSPHWDPRFTVRGLKITFIPCLAGWRSITARLLLNGAESHRPTMLGLGNTRDASDGNILMNNALPANACIQVGVRAGKPFTKHSPAHKKGAGVLLRLPQFRGRNYAKYDSAAGSIVPLLKGDMFLD